MTTATATVITITDQALRGTPGPPAGGAFVQAEDVPPQRKPLAGPCQLLSRGLMYEFPTVFVPRPHGRRLDDGHRPTRQNLEPNPAIRLMVTARTTAPSR